MRILLAIIALALVHPLVPHDTWAGEYLSGPLFHITPSPYVSDEIVVILRNISPANGFKSLAGHTAPGSEFRRIPVSDQFRKTLGGDMAVLKIPKGADLEKTIVALRADANVVHVSRNPLFYSDFTPNDPDYQEQWSLRDASSDRDIDVESAWDITRGSPLLKIGIIDTGVDTSHVDLKDNLIEGFDFCSSSPGDSTLDAEGYWLRPVGDYGVRDSFPFDEFGHGTHVAGTIGARGDNAAGVAGIAWNSKLVPLRAMHSMEMSMVPRYNLAMGSMVDIVAALDRARLAGCRVVNMSLSGSVRDTLLHAAVIEAFRAGMVLVASAGNTGKDDRRYPAAYPEVLSVSASGRTQAKASFSSYGDWVDVAAPGEAVYSTFPMNDDFYLKDQVLSCCTRDYGALSGSSMSAAHVSGIAALLLSDNPALTNVQVMDLIRGSADPVGGYDYSVGGRCPELGYGRVNAFNALFRSRGGGVVATGLLLHRDLDVRGDIVIPPGRTLEIGRGVKLRIAEGKTIRVSGTLKINDGAVFTRREGGSYWSGIDIMPGGVLEAAGDLTIEYAECGIDLHHARGISNGAHTLTIRDCRQAGIWIEGCSPFLRNIVCDRASDRTFQNGGITVSGPSASPRLRQVKVYRSFHGILVGNSASASVDSSDIRDEIGDCIQVNEGARIFLNGANNICPSPGRRAINNPPAGKIDAGNNYWGDSPDFRRLFTFPALVDLTGYAAAMFDGGSGPARALKPAGESNLEGEPSAGPLSVFPNPANPSATIRFVIGRPSRVSLAVYSITGQKVATLVDASLSAGTHAVSFDGSKYASGVYFYLFRSGSMTRSGKIAVVK